MHAHLNHIQNKRCIPHVLCEQLVEKRNNLIDSCLLYATGIVLEEMERE